MYVSMPKTKPNEMIRRQRAKPVHTNLCAVLFYHWLGHVKAHKMF